MKRVSVIPAKPGLPAICRAGIQFYKPFGWMPDQVRHDGMGHMS